MTKQMSKFFRMCLAKMHMDLRAYGTGKSISQHFKVKPSRLDLSQELRKDAENSRTEVEQAKNEAEAVRNDVDRKIEQNNAIWEKTFHQLMSLSRGYLLKR
ncbi:Cellulose synthase-like protein D2 [Bienertia sinuspersici]